MSTMLLQAIEQGDLEGAVAALDGGAPIDQPDMHGFPGLPLRMACFRGHNAIIAELLRRGADIDGANNEGPGAPLRLAVRGRHPETVRFLLERGAKKVPGLELELSLEEITRAQIVAQFNRQAAALGGAGSGDAAPEESLQEVLLQPDEFEALFGRFLTPPRDAGTAAG